MRLPDRRRLVERLAPISFVAGILLMGLALLASTFVATAPGYGPVEDHETTVVDDTALLAYPVPVSPQVAARIDVAFAYPEHPGDAMIVGCREYSALLQGQDPGPYRTSTSGTSGRLSSTVSPGPFADNDAPSGSCPFRYVVFQWALQGEAPAANEPDVTVTTSPVVLPAVLLGVLGFAGLLGLALALIGGTAWSRRLARTRRPVSAGDDEATSETLLLLIGKTGDWLTRTRRYLIAAGILGIFLWYPVVLPWAWNMALRGSAASWYPWLATAGALAVLLTVTLVWARAYLRLDRELIAWRDRMERLRERENELLAHLDATG